MLRHIIRASVGGFVCALLVSAAPAPKSQTGAVSAAAPTGPIQGDYIEARTASVFAGPCHYNAELMVTGREAIMAWHFTGGSFHGASLAGVNVFAAVSSPGNLADDQPRRSEITVDNSASPSQRAAAIELLKEQDAAALGTIISIHDAPVSFQHEGTKYVVNCNGFASLTAESMPNDECCKMPGDVWYAPLITLNDRKVGFTAEASYISGKLGVTWDRNEENSAFYGTFSM